MNDRRGANKENTDWVTTPEDERRNRAAAVAASFDTLIEMSNSDECMIASIINTISWPCMEAT